MRTENGAGLPPDRDLDDDSTVYADDDLIRQIRAASDAVVERNLASDDIDETVFADDDLIRQIRVAAGTPETETVPVEVEDETVFADDDLIRQIRLASNLDTPPDLVSELEAGTAVTNIPRGAADSGEPVDNEHTVMAGDDVIRAMRVGGVSPNVTPAESVEIVRRPGSVPPTDHVGDVARPGSHSPSAPPLDPLEELRRRFAPDTSISTGTLIPPWLMITGVAAFVILVVVVLAVVFVG